eukprot:2768150-Pyramimonas_sp.AAC.1
MLLFGQDYLRHFRRKAQFNISTASAEVESVAVVFDHGAYGASYASSVSESRVRPHFGKCPRCSSATLIRNNVRV